MPKKAKKRAKSPEYDSVREQNVLLDKIASDVKTVAEGHGTLNGKLDRVNARLDKHDERFDTIEAVVTENRKDIKGNTKAIKENKEAIKSLAAGQEEIKKKLDIVIVDHEQRLHKLEVAEQSRL